MRETDDRMMWSPGCGGPPSYYLSLVYRNTDGVLDYPDIHIIGSRCSEMVYFSSVKVKR